jgi:LPS-assembly lipoprotein
MHAHIRHAIEPAEKMRRRLLLTSLMAAPAVLLSGCGFNMRGYDLGLNFSTMALQGNVAIGQELRQILAAHPEVRVVGKPIEAQVVLVLMNQTFDRTIVAFSSAGRPREIQIRMRVWYRITDGYGAELKPPDDISQTRDITVSETETLALTSAENFMRDDMQRDIARQLLRRLRALRLPAA